ncbi:MAG: alpha/beta hydrolase [Bacteroidota bacterium]
MRLYLAAFFSFFLPVISHAQNGLPARYRDRVFTETVIQKDLSYATATHPGVKDKYYFFDLYEPKTDENTKRPLIIWMHGGGFTFGSKKAAGIKLWCEDFALRGYVCAGLNYPLSKSSALYKFTELKRSAFKAVQAVQEAITYFKKNAERYRIDTNRIILAGNSAGAIIALQAAYTSPSQLAEYAALPADLLSSKANPTGIAAVVNFWGGLFDLDWLQNAKVPIFSVYGSKDKVVTPDHKAGDTAMFGSAAIHQKAVMYKIPNQVKMYEGYAHELQEHFNPIFPVGKGTKERWLDAGQVAADFLYTQLF